MYPRATAHPRTMLCCKVRYVHASVPSWYAEGGCLEQSVSGKRVLGLVNDKAGFSVNDTAVGYAFVGWGELDMERV